MMTRQQRRRTELENRKKQKKERIKAQRELKEENTHSGLVVEKKESISNSKCSFKTVQEEEEAEQKAALDYLKVMQSQLPGLLKKLSEVKDFRNPKKVKHKIALILLFGILCFVFQKSSRRQSNKEMTTPKFLENLKLFFPDLQSLPHQDTLNRVLSMIDIGDIECVQIELIKRFIKSKKFVRYLVEKTYPVAIDGSQKYRYDFLWAEQCQRRKKGEKEHYYVYTLEASLAFRNGMVIPLATEFLNYMDGDVDSDKQDCELKAFKRLAEKLKGFFPRLKLMILLDGLYPNGGVFALCKLYQWDYMIVLQDKSLRSVWEEYYNLRDFERDRTNQLKRIWGNRYQKFTWVNHISYTYDNNKKEKTVHVVVCEEQWDEIAEDGSKVRKQSKHAWISCKPLSKKNVHERCNLGARHRWGIENGFLVEKRFGYQYEHTFSFNWNAMKGYHLLMRIAHMMNILAEYSTLLRTLFSKRGMRDAIKWLDEIFRKSILDPIRAMQSLTARYQIRFI